MNRTWWLTDDLEEGEGIKIEGTPKFSNLFLPNQCLVADTVGWLPKSCPALTFLAAFNNVRLEM